MERDYQGLDPSVGRKFICRMFEPRYFLIRQSITLGLGLLAALTWSVTLAFVFLSVLTVLILLKIYIWVTSLPLFRRLIRPRRIIVTAEGWWFILFTIAVGVAAINTGVSLLYLVFAMLPSLIVVSGILLELSFRKMEVERLVPPAVFCGEVFEIETVLSNHKKLFAAYSISLEEVGDSSLEVGESPYVLRVPPDGREWVRYNCVARKRGVLNLKGVVLKSVYPFGFFNKRMAIEHRDSVLVYPEIIPIRGDILPSAGQRQHILRRVSPFLAGDEDFRDLKEFREGENPRRIHWPLSAKHNKLLVREMEKQRAGRLLLVLDKSIPCLLYTS
ncbi:MAG: DUF58 domain-containing protein, partial [Planctomycetota bacterium]|nr:DUF58 domain-containing protein [Planctomycetota bacterium]